jgi:hypothetical protein
MKARAGGLVYDPGCFGCQKHCRFGGQVMNPLRASERANGFIYGCNGGAQCATARSVEATCIKSTAAGTSAQSAAT